MKLSASLLSIAAVAVTVSAAETEHVEPRLFSFSWGNSGSWANWGNSGVSWRSSWSTSGNSFQSGWLSWGQSCSSKPNYGASGRPESSWGQPGWYIGEGSCGGGIPKWDQGDYRWCSNSRYSRNDYCRRGNGWGKKPRENGHNWGHHGSHGWPKPKPGQGGDGQTSAVITTTFTSTSTVVPTSTSTNAPSTPTDAPSSISSDAPSSITSDAPSSSVTVVTLTSTSTSTGPVTIPTGVPDTSCTGAYQKTFNNLTTIADSGVYKGQVVGTAIVAGTYMTYGLAKKPEDCLTVCDQVAGCVFVNSFLDVEEDDAQDPRHSGLYTCSLYSACEPASKGTNFGGQNDPNYITDSVGWCKSEACKSS